MAHINTVKIKSGDSYAIINESDFDDANHELFDNPEPPAAPAPKKKPAKADE